MYTMIRVRRSGEGGRKGGREGGRALLCACVFAREAVRCRGCPAALCGGRVGQTPLEHTHTHTKEVKEKRGDKAASVDLLHPTPRHTVCEHTVRVVVQITRNTAAVRRQPSSSISASPQSRVAQHNARVSVGATLRLLSMPEFMRSGFSTSCRCGGVSAQEKRVHGAVGRG